MNCFYIYDLVRWMKSSWKHTLYLGPISKYAFTGYIRKWVSDKKSDRQKTVFSVHIEWPHLNSWAKQSSVVNKHGQKSMNMAIKMFSGLRLIETQRSKFGPIFCNKCRGEYSVWVPGGPSRLSFFKIWPFSAEFHITYMYDIFIYLAKIMLLRENLFMAEFFNSHQKLCQGTNDKKLIHIHNLYTPKLKRKPKDCFRSVTLGTLT